ncbi:hypothetical protein BHM03_00019898 [Ensete ventricosum]|nr:hypothetical protein BHM03_00019898 [Ensete ventricosum]
MQQTVQEVPSLFTVLHCAKPRRKTNKDTEAKVAEPAIRHLDLGKKKKPMGAGATQITDHRPRRAPKAASPVGCR